MTVRSIDSSNSTSPTWSISQRTSEVRAYTSTAPAFAVGRYSLQVRNIVVIYRLNLFTKIWEFLHITITGIWLDGRQRGETGYRRYSRTTRASLPSWLNDFIDKNTPLS